MSLKDTKLDSNGVQIAIVYFRKSIKIARQLLALSPDHVCHAHELKTPLLSTAPKWDIFRNILIFGFKLPQRPEQNPSCAPAVNTRNCYIHSFHETKMMIRWWNQNDESIVFFTSKPLWNFLYWFLVQMRTEIESSPQISGDMVSLHNMVSPQNGDTRGAPPPLSDTTTVPLVRI